MRRRTSPLVIALVLIVLGLVGLAAGAALLAFGGAAPARTPAATGSAGSRGAPLGRFSTNGQRIYLTGVGHLGRIPTQWAPAGGAFGMMRGRSGTGAYGGPGCVACHGADGRGGAVTMMMRAVEAPDIRYSTLTSPSEDASRTSPGWTDTQIADAIRTGVEPDGQRLDAFMPRWEMDTTDMTDTIDYLKELSAR
jgi:hypothetical protein